MNTSFQNITIFRKKMESDNSIKYKNEKNKIKMWTGVNLPNGYVWCDGDNNTPDLTDKFIYFVSNNVTNLTNTGVDDNKVSSIPQHNHTISSITQSYSNTDLVQFNIDSVEIKFPGNTTTDLRFNQGNKATPSVGNGGDHDSAHKNHTHVIDNNSSANANILKDTLVINLSHGSDQTATIQNNSSVNPNSTDHEVFQPKYIYIGFIMKV